MFKRILIASVMSIALIAPSIAEPVPRCGSRVTMLKILKEKFKEELVSVASLSPTVFLEVFVGKSGNFTMLSTSSQQPKISCVLTTGKNWTSLPKEKIMKKSKSARDA